MTTILPLSGLWPVLTDNDLGEIEVERERGDANTERAFDAPR